MAEADLVLTDFDLEDYSTVLEFVYAYRIGAPVHWAGRSWRIVNYHRLLKARGEHFTFELVEKLSSFDWGCAGWASLEPKWARLEDEALALACERWTDRLDPDLVWRMRVELFLEVAWRGRMRFERVRRLLEHGPYCS